MMCGIGRVTKTMCRDLLILAFFWPSLPARAADCFTGKWKLDPKKSYVDGSYCARLPKVHADLKLKRGSATFRHEGKDGYAFEISGEFNEFPFVMGAPVTFGGHAYQGVWGDEKVVFTSKRVGDHGFELYIATGRNLVPGTSATQQRLKVTEVLLFNVSSDGTILVLSDLPVGEKSPCLTMVFNKR